MKIFAIESSCDETACAIVEDGIKEIVSVVASSAQLHQKTGGIVPEIAARKQLESIIPVINESLELSKLSIKNDIDRIAVTVGPGLIGSLLVGIEAAKALALSYNKLLIPVNHLVGHIYSNYLEGENYKKIAFPAVVLVVSGGHTDLVLMKNHGNFEFLGGTLDDAAGEAFDKVARLLGLSKYLGGVALSKLSSTCTNNTLSGLLPRPLLDKDNFDFSFSGLKTAVMRLVEKGKYPKDVVACEFESAVVDVLITKTIKAVKRYSANSILLGGGVSANTLLRAKMKQEAEILGVPLFIPPLRLCGDNAAYIASAAFFNNYPRKFEEIQANPGLSIMDIYP